MPSDVTGRTRGYKRPEQRAQIGGRKWRLAPATGHINALSSALGMERRFVTYHLLTLEEVGFVTNRYELSEEPKSTGKTLRVCSR